MERGFNRMEAGKSRWLLCDERLVSVSGERIVVLSWGRWLYADQYHNARWISGEWGRCVDSVAGRIKRKEVYNEKRMEKYFVLSDVGFDFVI